LISILKDILDSSIYSILNIEYGIEIYYIESDMILQEKYIRIKNVDNKFVLYVVSRNDIKEIVASEDKILIVLISIVLCKKYFQHPQSDNSFIRELRMIVDAKNINQAKEMLKYKCNEMYYSIFEKEEKKICLLNKNGKISVVYKNGNFEKAIVEDAKLSRAFVVIYNYATLCETFDYIYNNELKKIEKESIDYYKLLEYYLFL